MSNQSAAGKQVITAVSAEDYKHLYLPARAAKVALEELKRRKEIDLYLDWGVPDIDRYVRPMISGDMVAIYGRPGHGKTSTALALAKRAEKVFLERQQDKRYVVYATWETSIAEFVTLALSDRSEQTLEDVAYGRANIEKVRKAISGFITGRIVVVGRAVRRPGESRIGAIPTLNDLDRLLAFMADNGMPVGLLVVDYLQRIPSPHADRRDAVSENADIVKDLAVTYGCPALTMVQAARDVDNYSGLQLAKLNDGQWSSTIEQSADIVMASTKPSNYLKLDDEIELGDNIYLVTPRTVVYRSLKVRWGAGAGHVFVADMDWSKYRLTGAMPSSLAF